MAEAWQSAWVEVLPDFKNFKSKANSEMSSTLGAAGTAGGIAAGKNVQPGIVGGIKSMVGPVIAAVAALGIGRLVGQSISAGIRYGIGGVGLASDLAETRTAIDQVFGEAGKDIQAFAETANRQLGQTRTEALRGAQTFGVFGAAAGLTGKPLADFSTELLTLSGDLASFFNEDPAAVIEALGAGLRGEAEPLRRFGVLMDDASLKAKALELGIIQSTKGALEPQQKILAAHALILEQTGIAQGDFGRTSDGLANQQRILAASLEDTQVKLGEALLPAFTGMAQFANETLVPALDGLIDKVGPILGEAMTEAAPKVQELLDKVLPLAEAFILSAAEEGIPALIDGLDDLADAAPEWIETFQQIDQTVRDMDQAFRDFQNDTQTQRADRIQWFDDVLTQFGSFFVTIDTEMDNWNADMKQWGNDLVAGFAQGIRDGQSAVIGAALDMAGAAVAKVQEVLEINSPSKVFARIGGSIPEGLSLGVDRGKKKVDASIRSLVDVPNIAASVDVTASGISGAGGGGFAGGITQHITVRDEDPRHFGRLMGRELIREMAGS